MRPRLGSRGGTWHGRGRPSGRRAGERSPIAHLGRRGKGALRQSAHGPEGVRKGKLRPVRLCRRLLFHPDDISRLLSEASHEPERNAGV